MQRHLWTSQRTTPPFDGIRYVPMSLRADTTRASSKVDRGRISPTCVPQVRGHYHPLAPWSSLCLSGFSLLPLLTLVLTMNLFSPRQKVHEQKGHDHLFSTSDPSVQALKLLQRTSRIPPAKVVFGSAAEILTTVLVLSRTLKANLRLTLSTRAGHVPQQTRLRPPWVCLR